MKSFFLLLIIGLVAWSCSNSGNYSQANQEQPRQKEVVIQTDMENAAGKVPSWNNEITVGKMPSPAKAHSGEYVCILDLENQYSYTYSEFFNNINNVVPKKIIVNGWANATERNGELLIVMDINNNGKSVIWKGNQIANQISTQNEWHEFTTEFTIDQPVQIANNVKIYAFGKGGKTYLDDLKITFEY